MAERCLQMSAALLLMGNTCALLLAGRRGGGEADKQPVRSAHVVSGHGAAPEPQVAVYIYGADHAGGGP